jgi:hypothetical protein
MMKKIIVIASVVFLMALSVGVYFLMTEDCTACTGDDCLNNGSVTFVARSYEPYCAYLLEVTGRTGCPSGAPYAWIQDTDCYPPIEYPSGTMGVSEQGDLCTDYSTVVLLKSGHTYTIWFECGYGYDGDYLVSPDCWE